MQIGIGDILEPMPKWDNKVSLIELYGGIGSQLKALKNIGVDVAEHYLVEVDIDATISYAAIHCNLNEELKLYGTKLLFPDKEILVEYLKPFNWWSNNKPKDITKLPLEKLQKLYLAQQLSNNFGDIFKISAKDLPKVDLITWSTPCTDFSLAGKQAGFEGDKGSLTFYTLKLFKELKSLDKLPTFLLFENVPAITNKKFIDGFNLMLKELEELGYENTIMRLNAKDFGIPQNRDRVFILSVNRQYQKDCKISTPRGIPLKYKLKDFLQDNPHGRDYDLLSEKYNGTIKQRKMIELLKSGILKGGEVLNHSYDREPLEELIETNGDYAPTLTTRPDILAVVIPVDEKYYLTDKQIKNIKNWKAQQKPLEKMEKVDKSGICPTLLARGQHDLHAGLVLIKEKPIRLGGLYDKENKQHQAGSIYDTKGISPTIDTAQGGNRQPLIKVGIVNNDSQGNRIYSDEGVSTTITASSGGIGSKTGLYHTQKRIRKLTELECMRLMGFDDIDYFAIKPHISAAQCYKQAGNSIVVNVLEAIFTQIFKGGTEMNMQKRIEEIRKKYNFPNDIGTILLKFIEEYQELSIEIVNSLDRDTPTKNLAPEFGDLNVMLNTLASYFKIDLEYATNEKMKTYKDKKIKY